MKLVFMFSGQGSQYFGMGRQLYQQEPEFRRRLDWASDLASPWLGGRRLVDILYAEGTSLEQPFDRTLHAAPALYAVQYALAQLLLERGYRPDYLLGYSLGELVAGALAGVYSFDVGMELAAEHAALLDRSCAPGAMMAVLDEPAILSRHPALFEEVWISGYNFSKHFVIAGNLPRLQALSQSLRRLSIVHQLLPISYGFHSPLIDDIQSDFKALVCRHSLRPPRVPIVSCAYRRTLEVADLGSDYYWAVLREPVGFQATIGTFEAVHGPLLFVDLGPSGTLAGFVRQCLPEGSGSTAGHAIDPYGNNVRTLSILEKTLESFWNPYIAY